MERDPESAGVAVPQPTETNKPIAPGLYLVATPIGNLEDITLRALRILRSVDRIAAEDTRQTAKLLHHFGIQTPTISYHRHNEAERTTELVHALKAGGRIAVVSDAGTPGIADPGNEIAAAAIASGLPVFPIPGASALLAAVVASGMAPHETGGFRFHGFLPAKAGQRRTVLEQLRGSVRESLDVFYETPHRIQEALADVVAVFGPAQQVALARELTKLHEEFLRGPAIQVLATLNARPTIRGEMVLMLAPGLLGSAETNGPQTIAEAVRERMAGGVPEKDALKQIARERGLGKSEIYREWQRTAHRGG